MQRVYTYFVYMLNSSSRRVLYTGITNALVRRVLEHRHSPRPSSFTTKYRALRLVYYEEYSSVNAAIAREKQIKGWTRAKKDALVRTMNPQWRDLISEWELKYGVHFEPDGRVVDAHAPESSEQKSTARSFAPKDGAQDDKVLGQRQ